MKYKIKMILPNICWLVACTVFTFLIILFCLISASNIFPYLIGVIFYLVAIKIPQCFFSTRLNDYFIIIRWPFSKWRNVFQKPNHVSETNPDLCRYKIRNLSRQMFDMFSSPLFLTGCLYRMTTHQTVVNHLMRLEKQGQIKIMACTPIASNTLKKELKHIVHCRFCKKKEGCRWHRLNSEPRQFYYVEFSVIR